MRNIDQKIRLLRACSYFVRVAALATVLPHTSAAERRSIVAELLDLAEHPRGPGWAAIEPLLLNWSLLDPGCQLALLDCAAHGLGSWLTRCTASDNASVRSNTYAIAADIAIALHDPASPLRHLLDRDSIDAALDASLASGAAEFTAHRNPAVLQAAIRLAHAPGPMLGAFLNDPSQTAHMPIRAEARKTAPATSGRHLVAWLACAALAPIAREAIESLQGPRLRDALEAADLLESPTIAAEARRIIRCRWLKPGNDSIADLPESSRIGLIRWARACAVREAPLLDLLGQFASDPSASVRRAAASTLAAAAPSPAMDLLLQTFANDADESVALIAAESLCAAASPSRRRSLQPFFMTMQESVHARVRDLAPSTCAESPADASLPRTRMAVPA